ncbi:ATP-binding protein [Patiriisocius hiemis]|uniref:ATP-binding protein n=1 Tax=Patiriisocius hiemis TaxID=3075604 RepID=A0ABU2YE20_9FLAO|nr:ATP-binding protein [Constantimarinum sp. W242]MDT0556428.1 ATP-binding protein [Constantimarinum sp. W242]
MEKILKQQPSDCIKIVLFGPESTGKTTLARELSMHFNSSWVPEYMREYLQEKWDTSKKVCEIDDLLPIAKGQIEAENKASIQEKKVLFCDTNLLELKVYSEYYYNGFCPEAIKNAALTNRYDFYFLTDIDVPWVKDDLRDRPNDRSTLFSIFEKELIQNKLPYQLLTGTKKNRLQTAITKVEKLLHPK